MIKVLIQVEAGSSERNLYNEKTLEYIGTNRIPLPYPYPYGFIVGTSAADGDCVDCYIITIDKLQRGSIIECDPVGLLEQDENGEVDHKVLAAIPGQKVVLDRKLLEELRGFIYSVFSHFPGERIQIGDILPREAALQHIREFQDGS